MRSTMWAGGGFEDELSCVQLKYSISLIDIGCFVLRFAPLSPPFRIIQASRSIHDPYAVVNALHYHAEIATRAVNCAVIIMAQQPTSLPQPATQGSTYVPSHLPLQPGPNHPTDSPSHKASSSANYPSP